MLRLSEPVTAVMVKERTSGLSVICTGVVGLASPAARTIKDNW